MLSTRIDFKIPLVAICNISEAFYGFLNRSASEHERLQLLRGEQYRGDRTLLWLGDRKLVFVSLLIPHAQDLCDQLGYRATRFLCPQAPSPHLCLDLLREKNLIEQMVEYAGEQRAIQLVPYATTHEFWQLVTALRDEYGLTVHLPESPLPGDQWVRDYIDTKTGFYDLVLRWLPDPEHRLPERFICRGLEQAARAAFWFSECGEACLVKANDGENGIGNHPVFPGQYPSIEALLQDLQRNAFLEEQTVVEKLIPSTRGLSPSLEMYVPPVEHGAPEITYLSNQVFLKHGDFCGVMLSQELNRTRWYQNLVENGLAIAGQLQALGYVGHFDLDAVVGDQDDLYLLEVNSRRTGGTHVHEFARFYFGEDYLDRVTIISHDSMSSGEISTYPELKSALQDLLFPIDGAQRGIVITITSALEVREFGCLFIAASLEEGLTLQQRAIERVKNWNWPSGSGKAF